MLMIMQEYQTIEIFQNIAKRYTPSYSENVFMIKNTVLWTFVTVP